MPVSKFMNQKQKNNIPKNNGLDLRDFEVSKKEKKIILALVLCFFIILLIIFMAIDSFSSYDDFVKKDSSLNIMQNPNDYLGSNTHPINPGGNFDLSR